MSNLEKTPFQLKFTAKSLHRQAKKAQKDENVEEKIRLKKLCMALQQGNNDGARIYSTPRTQSERRSVAQPAPPCESVACRVEMTVTMRHVTGNMMSVVKGMDKAMETMNLERISLVMDEFEAQFSDLDVQTSYMEDAMCSTTAVSTPQDQVDSLMHHADKEVRSLAPPERSAVIGVEDSTIADRLRALWPAT
ncbi:hypothetical protein BGW80DRAFT_1438644 [Lactifluus volemus]|nr:hypothetical protein BGW80DRAFT_1438644 [Lactifluus volemus]